jgi:hypothetical protein
MGRLRDGAALTRFEITGDDCWVWKGTVHDGYGRMWWKGRLQLVHRIIYELANGPIPEGLECDHLCRNRLCVNPDHIELVTGRENVLRGIGPSAQHARQTHCKRGHPLAGENIYKPYPSQPVVRRCKECARTYDREWKRAYRLRKAGVR